MTAHADLFAGLPASEVEMLTALGSRVVLQSGAVLFRIGDDATHLHVVERGAVALTMPMQVEGRHEDVRVDECLPGHTLGWSTLVPPHRFTLKATARQQTEVLTLPRDVLLAHFTRRPEVGYVVMQNLAAVLGQRLQVFQAMWLREMQHGVDLSHG